jgi:organic hydroperoxide reductase OsmC/OhrA
MSDHLATIRWQRTGPDFLKGQFSRAHTWTFDGGATIDASAAPSAVPEAYVNPAGVDPEEALVASISSCHMLTFLHLASKKGYEVESYEDHAIGRMTKNDAGVPWVSSVALRPKIVYSGQKQPSPDDEEQLHHSAHKYCFIANSVKTEVTVEPAP